MEAPSLFAEIGATLTRRARLRVPVFVGQFFLPRVTPHSRIAHALFAVFKPIFGSLHGGSVYFACLVAMMATAVLALFWRARTLQRQRCQANLQLEEKKAEVARFESGQVQCSLLVALLENTSDLVYFKDLNSRFICVSKTQAERFHLADPAEAEGKSDEDFFGSEHSQDALQDEREIIRTGLPLIDKEEKEGWLDGREWWVSTSKMALRDGRGQIVGTMGISHDITKRKQAEEALIAEHAESELFINSVPSIFVGTDCRAHIIRWNDAATATFGLSAFEVRGKPLFACGIRWLQPAMKEDIESWLQMESAHTHEGLAFERDGEKRFLAITVKTVNFLNEKGAGLLITGVDASERMNLENQLRQAQKLEAIGQLAAGVAHEINTPTQFIGHNLKFLEESWPTVKAAIGRRQGEVDGSPAAAPMRTTTIPENVTDDDLDYVLEEIPRAIEQSLDGVQRIAGIVRAMKEFSHPGSGENRPENLNKAIETTILVTRNEWKYVAELVTGLDPTLPEVCCSIGEINQVILNLLVNAAHAIRDKSADGKLGTITVTTRQVDGLVEVAISDTGAGIPENVRARVFEPFFTTKEVGRGTGQGLALAHNVVVKKHGGSIWFETEVGKGTTFFLQLPLVRAGNSEEAPRGNHSLPLPELGNPVR